MISKSIMMLFSCIIIPLENDLLELK